MKKSAILLILAVLVLAMIPAATLMAEPDRELPMDVMIFREELEAELDTESIKASNGLPVVTPFWVDMVDADVTEDGEGVYVAVLDTGLLEDWPFFFSEANIADELGIGFTHDIWWDGG
ncbi:MAG: hypothetical protein JSW53_03585, partial [Candidatus Bathyarchaeota archaeon]